MAEEQKPEIGTIVWTDLTVDNAETVRDFYSEVVGWKPNDHDMGEYNDFDMNKPESGETVTGVCHARGSNANVPPQWMIYIQVADVDASAKRCKELGGKIIDGPRKMGPNRFCVIEDPAGAVAALID